MAKEERRFLVDCRADGVGAATGGTGDLAGAAGALDSWLRPPGYAISWSGGPS
ncbi:MULTISPECIES: hypothetical protein [unclassified Streptomyces]|uniref:hypothetical protein n=1 Tax=unclassified Streptomyces TaxID=2593676 RepID=UPI000B2E4C59|nr:MULTISPECIES: hypothetical protein [unclassified Streptomyces]